MTGFTKAVLTAALLTAGFGLASLFGPPQVADRWADQLADQWQGSQQNWGALRPADTQGQANPWSQLSASGSQRTGPQGTRPPRSFDAPGNELAPLEPLPASSGYRHRVSRPDTSDWGAPDLRAPDLNAPDLNAPMTRSERDRYGSKAVYESEFANSARSNGISPTASWEEENRWQQNADRYSSTGPASSSYASSSYDTRAPRPFNPPANNQSNRQPNRIDTSGLVPIDAQPQGSQPAFEGAPFQPPASNTPEPYFNRSTAVPMNQSGQDRYGAASHETSAPEHAAPGQAAPEAPNPYAFVTEQRTPSPATQTADQLWSAATASSQATTELPQQTTPQVTDTAWHRATPTDPAPTADAWQAAVSRTRQQVSQSPQGDRYQTLDRRGFDTPYDTPVAAQKPVDSSWLQTPARYAEVSPPPRYDVAQRPTEPRQFAGDYSAARSATFRNAGFGNSNDYRDKPLVEAQELAPVDMVEEPYEPTIHIVTDGDTLAQIAERYLGDASQATQLFDANQSVLDDPELLPIGAEITIPSESMSRPMPTPNTVGNSDWGRQRDEFSRESDRLISTGDLSVHKATGRGSMSRGNAGQMTSDYHPPRAELMVPQAAGSYRQPNSSPAW